jgi:hypothetical protein
MQKVKHKQSMVLKQAARSKWLRIVNVMALLHVSLMISSCQRQAALQSPDTTPLLSEFRARFEARVQSFMQTSPQLVNVYKSNLSPTRLSVSMAKYRLQKPASFSVVAETPSQTMGYILLDTISNNLSWGNCGDIKDSEGNTYGFSSEAGALASRKTPACFESDFLSGGIDGGLRFEYLYSAGSWQLKSVTNVGSLNLEMKPITHVLGMPQADQIDAQLPESQAINQRWRAAFLDGSP